MVDASVRLRRVVSLTGRAGMYASAVGNDPKIEVQMAGTRKRAASDARSRLARRRAIFDLDLGVCVTDSRGGSLYI